MSADPESTLPRGDAETNGPAPDAAASTEAVTNGGANGSAAHENAGANGEPSPTTEVANGNTSEPPPAAFPSFPPPGSVPNPSASVPPPAADRSAAGGAPSGKPPHPKRGEAPEDEHAMTLWEHLDELRSRIIRMIIAFLIGAVIAWIFRSELLHLLSDPFIKAWPKALPSQGTKPELAFASPAALFVAYVRLAAMGGLVFALPIILYQVWAFVAPGLYAREKKFAAPFVLSSCALFALGGWFGWRFAFPAAFQFLLGLANSSNPDFQIRPMLMVGDYIEFVTHMLLAFGFMSELPILVFFLSIAGVINHTHLIKFYRYFIVVAFVAAAILTPPDPMSQLMLAIPLIFLYGISILVAWIFGRKNLGGAASSAEPKKA